MEYNNLSRILLNLPESEMYHKPLEELEAALGKSQGRLRIVVHPFYMDNDENSRFASAEELVSHQRNREAHVALFKSESPVKLPTLILESHIALNDMVSDPTLIRLGNNLFAFPTHDGQPVPYYPEHHNLRFNNNYQKSWEKFISLLDKVGVNEVLLSGMLLTVRNTSSATGALSKQLEQQGVVGKSLEDCVGGVAIHLADRFKISISNMTSPDSLWSPARAV